MYGALDQGDSPADTTQNQSDHSKVWEDFDEKDNTSVSDIEIGMVRAEQLSTPNQRQMSATDQRQKNTYLRKNAYALMMYTQIAEDVRK